MFRNVALIWDEEPFPFFSLCNENQTHQPTLSVYVCISDQLLLLLVLPGHNSHVRGFYWNSYSVCVCDRLMHMFCWVCMRGKGGLFWHLVENNSKEAAMEWGRGELREGILTLVFLTWIGLWLVHIKDSETVMLEVERLEENVFAYSTRCYSCSDNNLGVTASRKPQCCIQNSRKTVKQSWHA